MRKISWGSVRAQRASNLVIQMFHQTHNLAGYVEGSLDPRSLARVEKHLSGCAYCRAALGDMKSVGRLLNAVGTSAEPVRFDAEIWSRVHAQISTPHRQAPVKPRWALAGGGFALAAAAICLVVILQNGAQHPQYASHPETSASNNPSAKALMGPGQKTRVAKVPRGEKPASAGSKWESETSPSPLNVLTDSKPIPQAPPMPGADSPTAAIRPEAKTLVAEMPGLVDRSRTLNYSNQPSNAYGYKGDTLQPSRGTILNDQHQSAGMAGRMGENAMGGASTSYFQQNGTPIPGGHPLPAGTRVAVAGAEASPPAAVGGDLSARPKAARELAATAAPNDSALDIVSDKGPDMPRTPLTAERQPDGSPLGLALKPKALAAGTGIASYRAMTVDTGVSTLKGHELLGKADRAFAAGNMPVAVQFYADADKAGLSSAESRLSIVRRADIALQENDALAAVKLYRAAVAKRKDAEVLAKLGDASERAGLATEAIEAYREALSLAPDFKPAKDGLAKVKKP